MTGVADQLVARLRPDRLFGVRVELPQLLAGLRLVPAHPAVALRRDDLHDAADRPDRRRRPLAVQNAILDRVVLPDELAGRLVHGDDRRRARRRDVDVAFVLAVRRAHENQIAPHRRRRVGQVVRIGADLFHHVERPDDVGVVHAGELLVGDGAVVLLVAEPFDVDGKQHGAIADVVQRLAVDERGRGDALIRPVVRASGLELRVRVLPQELAVGFAERHQHAAIAGLLRIAQPFVVRADEHHAAGDDRIAVALRAEIGDPLDVLLRLDVPVGRQPLGVRHHVAVGRAAPHRPVARAGIGGDKTRRAAARSSNDANADAQSHSARCFCHVQSLIPQSLVVLIHSA